MYSAAPSLAMLQNEALVDSLHQRMGGAAWDPTADDRADKGRLWARAIGNDGKLTPKGNGVQGGDGARFDYRTYALQLGVDVLRQQDDEGRRTAAGLYVAQAHSYSNVTHYDGRAAGKNTLNSSSIGGYWTRFYPEGSYIDLVGQYSHHSLSSSSTSTFIKPNGNSVTLSAEGGRAYTIKPNLILEPQVQLRVQRGSFNDANDGVSRISYGDFKSLNARAGVRLAYTEGKSQFWGRLDLLHEFEGKTTTTVSNMAGLYGLGVPTSLRGTSVALTGGLNSQINASTSLFGSGTYQQRLSGRGHSVGIMAGVKVRW